MNRVQAPIRRHALGGRGARQSLIERRQRAYARDGEFEIGGIVESEMMAARKREDGRFLRKECKLDRQFSRSDRNVARCVSCCDTATTHAESEVTFRTSNHQSSRHKGVGFSFQESQGCIGRGRLRSSGKYHAGSDRGVDERNGILQPASFVLPGKISSTVTAGVFVCFRNFFHRFAPRFSATHRHQERICAIDFAMAGDHDRFALLDLIEQFGELGLGLGRLNSVSYFDRSI